MTTIICQSNPIVESKIAFLRDKDKHNDPQKFYKALVELGSLLGYEIARTLQYRESSVKTPLGTANAKVIDQDLVVAGILRAGLPVQQGIAQMLDSSTQAFIGAHRTEDGNNIGVELNYIAGPALSGKTLILSDTMLATGKSLELTYSKIIAKLGKPDKLIIACVIASQDGLNYIQEKLPAAEIYVCVVDPELNDSYYIVPGLGDAGDLLFGEKL